VLTARPVAWARRSTSRPRSAGRSRSQGGIWHQGSDRPLERNLPADFKGSRFTPEDLRVYSDTFADNTFGVAITASDQDRAAGYNPGAVQSGYHSILGSDTNAWGSITHNPNNVHYQWPRCQRHLQVPQDLRYLITGHRAQAHERAADAAVPDQSTPSRRHLDYTYSENKIHQRRQEISAWSARPFGLELDRRPGCRSVVISSAQLRQHTHAARSAATGPISSMVVPNLAMARSDFATKAKKESSASTQVGRQRPSSIFEFDGP